MPLENLHKPLKIQNLKTETEKPKQENPLAKLNETQWKELSKEIYNWLTAPGATILIQKAIQALLAIKNFEPKRFRKFQNKNLFQFLFERSLLNRPEITPRVTEENLLYRVALKLLFPEQFKVEHRLQTTDLDFLSTREKDPDFCFYASFVKLLWPGADVAPKGTAAENRIKKSLNKADIDTVIAALIASPNIDRTSIAVAQLGSDFLRGPLYPDELVGYVRLQLRNQLVKYEHVVTDEGLTFIYQDEKSPALKPKRRKF